MKWIDSKTVELTDREMHTKDTFEGHLIEGHSIPAAARMALNHHNIKDREFIAYLSEGTCDRFKGRVRVKPEWRMAPDHTGSLTIDEIRERLGMVTS